MQSYFKMTKAEQPTPLFILQNSKPITALFFSAIDVDLFYTGNRDGDLNVYSLKLRRSLFNANPQKQAIMCMIELDNQSLLTYCRDGAVFKWNRTNTDWTCSC